jgi:hypothetical protein
MHPQLQKKPSCCCCFIIWRAERESECVSPKRNIVGPKIRQIVVCERAKIAETRASIEKRL